jgi:hypothetical protein
MSVFAHLDRKRGSRELCCSGLGLTWWIGVRVRIILGSCVHRKKVSGKFSKKTLGRILCFARSKTIALTFKSLKYVGDYILTWWFVRQYIYGQIYIGAIMVNGVHNRVHLGVYEFQFNILLNIKLYIMISKHIF